ncbi:MAG TPA: hypothetical protein VM366_15105 [Anaerolineae bacterium]|nr:hypothetical protein [Anaerolineae bacterium]
MSVTRSLGVLYRLLLHLYPRRFRDEFAWEMQAVFEHALADASEARLWAVCAVTWRELRDSPRAVIVAHLRERRRVMEPGSIPARPVPWWAMLAVVSLFALPVLAASFTIVSRPIEQCLFLGLLAFALLAFARDAIKIKRAPRWSLPYAGLLLVVPVSSLLYGSSPMVRLHGHVVRAGDELSRYAWQAIRGGALWLSLLAILGLVVLLCAMLPSLRPAWRAIHRDWTGLSFLLYGTVVFVYFVDLNEYQYEGPYVVAGMLSLVLGAWAYLRGKTTRRRILALLSGMTLAMWIVAIGKWVIVPRQDWPVWFDWHPPESERWFESLGEVIAWVWMMVALAAPALLALLPRAQEPASSTRLA